MVRRRVVHSPDLYPDESLVPEDDTGTVRLNVSTPPAASLSPRYDPKAASAGGARPLCLSSTVVCPCISVGGRWVMHARCCRETMANSRGDHSMAHQRRFCRLHPIPSIFWREYSRRRQERVPKVAQRYRQGPPTHSTRRVQGTHALSLPWRESRAISDARNARCDGRGEFHGADAT